MSSDLPRTYSDPDLPQLLPLPLRPNSSYETRPQVQEYAQFPENVVQLMAKKLRVNVQQDPELRWVVRDCLLTLAQEGWKCEARGKDLTYFNPSTEETRPFHIVEDTHKELADHLKMQKNEMAEKKKNRFYWVQEVVYSAIMGERDVRGVVSISVLEEVLEALNVDVQDEPFLILTVKNAIEDAYFRMKRLGPHLVKVGNCIDVHSLVMHLELDRVSFLKKISPSGLLYCVQCEVALADVACGSCHDCFCNNCMVATHSRGHRMDHPAVFIEQCVCRECEEKAALVRCQECTELFCYECYQKTHEKGKRARHCVRLPCTTFCFNCDENEASYLCQECEDIICSQCSMRLHRKGARQNHTLFGLRKAAYSRKLFGNNIDKLMKIVQTKEDMSLPLSPWVLLYDEAKIPFWYNCQSREKVRADPTDLLNPPVPEDTTMPSPDEQLLMSMPGSTNLFSTHAARKALEGAVFEVPRPMLLHFSSPQKHPSHIQMERTGLEEDFKRTIGAQDVY